MRGGRGYLGRAPPDSAVDTVELGSMLKLQDSAENILDQAR